MGSYKPRGGGSSTQRSAKSREVSPENKFDVAILAPNANTASPVLSMSIAGTNMISFYDFFDDINIDLCLIVVLLIHFIISFSRHTTW